jgi:hypothetical protein
MVVVGERGWWLALKAKREREREREREKKAFKWIIAAAVVSDQPVPDRDGLFFCSRAQTILFLPLHFTFFYLKIFFLSKYLSSHVVVKGWTKICFFFLNVN